jgi:hypothetical protein
MLAHGSQGSWLTSARQAKSDTDSGLYVISAYIPPLFVAGELEVFSNCSNVSMVALRPGPTQRSVWGTPTANSTVQVDVA